MIIGLLIIIFGFYYDTEKEILLPIALCFLEILTKICSNKLSDDIKENKIVDQHFIDFLTNIMSIILLILI